jgi:F-type H+-transporting ATPase subunit b
MRRYTFLSGPLAAAIIAFGLTASTPALGAPDGAPATEQHDGGHEDGHHGDAHDDAAHGDDAHGEGDHAGEHHYYTHDDDGDGTPNWRDSDSGETYVLMDLIFHLINLLILMGIFAYAARPAVSAFFRNRALAIRTELTDTKEARDAAAAGHAEIVARLAKVEQEVADIDSKAAELAAHEHKQLVARAHAEASRIGDTAKRNIRDEVARARNDLRKEAVELAVALAENTLRANVNRSDQQELARQFLDSLAASQVNADA